ncbi:TetR/AcrR family transcriptional regulator [Streptomyces sp. NPDC048639]|uniref:TetR/AcrR family transcriptional regulator n=1 Tax=Streptomyces sp. NPDC048639 TaxID=3365581 RepID=UPI00371A19CC
MTSGATRSPDRLALIADTAIDLLAERGLRGLTHRAVDEAAGLPPGSTSNHARTRAALLEATVKRLAARDEQAFRPEAVQMATAGLEAVTDALAPIVHRYVTDYRHLLVARYELALEATRRPEVREIYDAAGHAFRELLVALMTRMGSSEPERHALSLIAWTEGVMFSCAIGAHHTRTPTREELRESVTELLRGMLPGRTA